MTGECVRAHARRKYPTLFSDTRESPVLVLTVRTAPRRRIQRSRSFYQILAALRVPKPRACILLAAARARVRAPLGLGEGTLVFIHSSHSRISTLFKRFGWPFQWYKSCQPPMLCILFTLLPHTLLVQQRHHQNFGDPCVLNFQHSLHVSYRKIMKKNPSEKRLMKLQIVWNYRFNNNGSSISRWKRKQMRNHLQDIYAIED